MSQESVRIGININWQDESFSEAHKNDMSIWQTHRFLQRINSLMVSNQRVFDIKSPGPGIGIGRYVIYFPELVSASVRSNVSKSVRIGIGQNRYRSESVPV